MNIRTMTFDKKTYVNPDLESTFRELPIVQVVFALDDTLLEYKNGSYYYSKDNNIIFSDNLALQGLINGKVREYDTLEFVKVFIVGKENKDCFRLSSLMLNYYYLNYQSKKILWQDSFYKKYGVFPPSYMPPRTVNKLNYIVNNHDDSNNKYLIAHFSKMYNIDEYLIKDMIFRKFLVADRLRNACFPIYSDVEDKTKVVGMHLKSTKYNNSYTDYIPPSNNEVYCYISAKHEGNINFTYLHIFETPLQLMKYVSQIKTKTIKFPRGSSHLFAVFNTADKTALEELCMKYHFDVINYVGINRLYIEMVSIAKPQIKEKTEDNIINSEIKIPAKTNKVNVTIFDDEDDEEMPF